MSDDPRTPDGTPRGDLDPAFARAQQLQEVEDGLYRLLLAAGVRGREAKKEWEPESERFHRRRDLLRGIARATVDALPPDLRRGAAPPDDAIGLSLGRALAERTKGNADLGSVVGSMAAIARALPVPDMAGAPIWRLVPAPDGIEVFPGVSLAALIRDGGCAGPEEEALAADVIWFRVGRAIAAGETEAPRTADEARRELHQRWTARVEAIAGALEADRLPEEPCRPDPARWIPPGSDRLAGTEEGACLRAEALDQSAWMSLRVPIMEQMVKPRLKSRGFVRLPRHLVRDRERLVDRYVEELHDGWPQTRLAWFREGGTIWTGNARKYFAQALLNLASRLGLRAAGASSDPLDDDGSDASEAGLGRMPEPKAGDDGDADTGAFLAACHALLPWPVETALETCRESLPKDWHARQRRWRAEFSAWAVAERKRRAADRLGQSAGPESDLPKSPPPRPNPRPAHAAWAAKAESLDAEGRQARAALAEHRERAAEAARRGDRAAWLASEIRSAEATLRIGMTVPLLRRAGEHLLVASREPEPPGGLQECVGDFWFLASRRPEAMPEGTATAADGLRHARTAYEEGARTPGTGVEGARFLARAAACAFADGDRAMAGALFRRALDATGAPLKPVARMLSAIESNGAMRAADRVLYSNGWCAVRAAHAKWATCPSGGNYGGISKAVDRLLGAWRARREGGSHER